MVQTDYPIISFDIYHDLTKAIKELNNTAGV